MVDIEYAFIGGCLFDDSVLKDTFVQPIHFSDQLCASLFAEMRNGCIDALILAKKLNCENEVGVMIDGVASFKTRQLGREIVKNHRKRIFLKAIEDAHSSVSSGGSIDSAVDLLNMSAINASTESKYKQISEVGIDIYREMQDRIDGNVNDRFIKTGFIDFDNKYGGLEKASLVIVAGRSSMGKTSWAMSAGQHIAKTHAVAFQSIEMDFLQVGYRMVSSLSGFDLAALRSSNNISSEVIAGVSDATTEMSKLDFIVDDNSKRSVLEIAAQARKQNAIKNIDLLIIDYLGLIDCEGNKQRHLEIATMTRILKGLSKELDCCVMLLCQFNREAEKGRPKPSHLRESGSIEQDGDMIIAPYRYTDIEVDKKSGSEIEIEKAELIMLKNRNGQTGFVPVHWHGKTASYKTIEQKDRF